MVEIFLDFYVNYLKFFVVLDGFIEQSDATNTETGQEYSFLNSEPQNVSTPVQKKARGRPPKKMRGRNVKMERAENMYSMAAEPDDSNTFGNMTPMAPIVMKFTVDVKAELSRDNGMILNQSEPIMAKRGRGRPRKIKGSPKEKTFIEDCSQQISYNSGGIYYRPDTSSFIKSADDLENNTSQLPMNQNSNISEVKTRLRGRPRTNYLFVQKMWTPKTENFRKHRVKKTTPDTPVVKGPRGRPRIHPLPDPNVVKVRGRPRLSYDPDHIKMLLEKRQAGGDHIKKSNTGLRGRPTKLEALKLMLEDRRQQASYSYSSTKSTTLNQASEDDSECLELEDSQLTFPLVTMLDEIHGSKCGENIENKENFFFVSSKALCDNRKLKEKLLERTDPVFREMKLKFRQELKSIQKSEVKAKPLPTNQGIKRRGPRGPYKKKNATSDISDIPEKIPISQRLIAKRAAEAAAAAARSLQPRPEPRPPVIRKKIVPIYKNQQLPGLLPHTQYVTPTCTIQRIPENRFPSGVIYPSDMDRFMKANNLTYRPVTQNQIVTKNPFLAQNKKHVNKPITIPKVLKKRGRPRKYPLPAAPIQIPSRSNGGSVSAFIDLISSDDDDGNNPAAHPMNYTYPYVENEPVFYDDEQYEDSFTPQNSDDNVVCISLLSDDEDDDQ